MPDLSEDATLTLTDLKVWVNWHRTVSHGVAGLYDIYNPKGAATLEGMRRTIGKIQDLLRLGQSEGRSVRAIGSGWSLSEAPTTDGYVVNTRNLNWRMNLGAKAVHPGYAGDPARLVLFQAGNMVAEVNKYLETPARRLSLRTSGAANGQTIVGAASTNTHGSALSFGPIQDHIRAIHLITGPKSAVLLQRESSPVTTPYLADQLGAELISDDSLFNAVLVSFGSMGIIHAVIIEARPRFLLETHNRKVAFNDDLRRLVDTLDTSRFPMPVKGERPYFLQVIFNPFDKKNEAYLTAMYERDCPDSYLPKYSATDELQPGYDLLSLLGDITDAVPALTGGLVGAAAEKLMTLKSRTGTLGETFTYKTPQTKVASASVGVEGRHTSRAIDLMYDLHREISAPICLVCRWTQPSPALLAASLYAPTCMIGLDGVDSDRTRRYFARSLKALEAAGIPFTQHWGKTGDFSPNTLQKTYGTRLDAWKVARNTLLGDAERKLFSSAFTRKAGLD